MGLDKDGSDEVREIIRSEIDSLKEWFLDKLTIATSNLLTKEDCQNCEKNKPNKSEDENGFVINFGMPALKYGVPTVLLTSAIEIARRLLG